MEQRIFPRLLHYHWILFTHLFLKFRYFEEVVAIVSGLLHVNKGAERLDTVEGNVILLVNFNHVVSF